MVCGQRRTMAAFPWESYPELTLQAITDRTLHNYYENS